VREKVRNFIFENFLFGGTDAELKDDDSFLEQGIIDSTGMLELVAFIDENFGITVEDEELVPENLDSINVLVEFISRKKTLL